MSATVPARPRRRGFTRGAAAFAALLVSGAAVRLLAVLTYQPIFLLQRDTYTYLSLAVRSIETAPGFRPPLYPWLFVKPLLVADSLLVVAVTQHIVGMAMSAALYAAMRRLDVPPVPAALGVAPLLLDAYQINIEHYLLAETFFQGLLVCAFTLLVWWARPALPVVGLAGLLLGLAALSRFVGIALLLPALAYIALVGMGWRRAGILLVTFALPLAGYSVWFKGSSDTLGVTDRNGFFLYGRVGSFADCPRFFVPVELRRFCFDLPPSERGSNFGFFSLQNAAELQRLPGVNGLLLEFSRRAILGQPVGYAQAVWGDFMRFFSTSPPPAREPYVRRWRFPRELADADPHPFVVRHGGSAPSRLGFQSFGIDPWGARRLRAYGAIFYTPGPLLGLLLLLGIAGSAVGTGDARRRGLRGACLLFSSGGLLLLLFPVMITVYHFRYVLSALPLLGPAGALGATAIVGRARRSRGSLRAPRGR
ncbi:MAG: hypothetical protein ABR529_12510 [Actinomycetota bacterium]